MEEKQEIMLSCLSFKECKEWKVVSPHSGRLSVRGNVLLPLLCQPPFYKAVYLFNVLYILKAVKNHKEGKNNWKINSVSNSPHILSTLM